MIKVTAYQSIDGDCIWLRYGDDKKTNILIDLGRLSTYKTSIKKVFDHLIHAEESLSLLLVTHTDSDHIGGFKALFSNAENIKRVKTVLLNHPHANLGSNNDLISYRQGDSIYSFCKNKNISILSNITNKSESLVFGKGKLTILSPNLVDLKKVNDAWLKDDKISGKQLDWALPISKLTVLPDHKDNSITNRGSVAFLFQYEDKKALFLGDSHPDIVADKIFDLGWSAENPLHLQLVKLSHHGSRNNISLRLLQIIRCKNFLISDNGRRLSKETLAKIIKFNGNNNNERLNFHFNYSEEKYMQLFSNDEMSRYSFNCHYGDSSVNGIEISL